ncbi:hypothetical protein ACFSGX_07805 [Sphingomonas arantia]|uniref:Uncharacterized protein n=1 Tax=Sphingomonas arantia TaxID=1460676 RepID=A0ABW4TVD2_9SPHN
MIDGTKTLNGNRHFEPNAEVYLEQAHAVAILLQQSFVDDAELNERILTAACGALTGLIERAAVAARQERETAAQAESVQ